MTCSGDPDIWTLVCVGLGEALGLDGAGDAVIDGDALGSGALVGEALAALLFEVKGIPLFQTNFFPDLTQENFLPL